MHETGPPRLSRLEVVRRLFRRFSQDDLSPADKLFILKRIITRLTTSPLTEAETKALLTRVILKLKRH